MNDFRAVETPDETFRVDPAYVMSQQQKELAEAMAQLTLQRAGLTQSQDNNLALGGQVRNLQQQLEDAQLHLRNFELFKNALREHGFDPDVFVEEMNKNNLGGTVLRVGKRIVEASIERPEDNDS